MVSWNKQKGLLFNGCPYFTARNSKNSWMLDRATAFVRDYDQEAYSELESMLKERKKISCNETISHTS